MNKEKAIKLGIHLYRFSVRWLRISIIALGLIGCLICSYAINMWGNNNYLYAELETIYETYQNTLVTTTIHHLAVSVNAIYLGSLLLVSTCYSLSKLFLGDIVENHIKRAAIFTLVLVGSATVLTVFGRLVKLPICNIAFILSSIALGIVALLKLIGAIINYDFWLGSVIHCEIVRATPPLGKAHRIKKDIQ